MQEESKGILIEPYEGQFTGTGQPCSIPEKQVIYLAQIEECHKLVDDISRKTNFIRETNILVDAKEEGKYMTKLEGELAGLIEELSLLNDSYRI